jgi:two-component system sensor histidine kinase DcuS
LAGTGKIETKISVLESTNVLRILVHDSGVGIPAELREKVFTEGVSTKGEGRGLGLWLIREAAHSLKGSISYEYDNGAKFLVHIPLD